jgi:hypothetical protein
MLVFRDFSITTTVSIPLWGQYKKLLQNRFGYVQIEPNFSRNQFGIGWDWLLADVVQIQEAAVRKVLCVGQMCCVRDVVSKIELVPNHRISPKMSGRNSARRTMPLVYLSMATLNSGLGNCLPLMMSETHVLLTFNFRAIAILAPRGLVLKNSSNVICNLHVV